MDMAALNAVEVMGQRGLRHQRQRICLLLAQRGGLLRPTPAALGRGCSRCRVMSTATEFERRRFTAIASA